MCKPDSLAAEGTTLYRLLDRLLNRLLDRLLDRLLGVLERALVCSPK